MHLPRGDPPSCVETIDPFDREIDDPAKRNECKEKGPKLRGPVPL